MLSKLSIFLVMLFVVSQVFNERAWDQEDKVIVHDVNEYYIYLPAAVIHHDLSLNFLDKKSEKIKYAGKYWHLHTPEGKKIFKMTMGMSMMYAPFFLLSHACASFTGKEALGFSEVYRKGIVFSSLFYLIFGYVFLMKVLRKYFDDWLSALVILCVGLGTNLYYYSTTEAPMSHAYSFSLISIFLYLVHWWYESPKLRKGVFLGIVFGLMVVIRPTNIVFILYFIFFNTSSIDDVKDRIRLFWDQKKSLLSFLFFCLLVGLPQMIYWKLITGHLVYNPHVGESFFLSDPEVINTLFSYRKGWFIYTPLMFLAMIGMGGMAYRNIKHFIPIMGVLVLSVYLISSWWCWWYGGSFGNRAFIDLYPLMAFGLGHFFLLLIQLSKRWLFLPSLVLVFFLIKVNFFQSEQYRSSLLHWDSMTKELYWEVFMSNQWPENYDKLISPPDYEAALKGEEKY